MGHEWKMNTAPGRVLCCAQILSPVGLFVTPWIVVYLALLSLGFSRQEYWGGLPFPPPRDLPDPWVKPTSSPSLHCRKILYHWATREALSRSKGGWRVEGEGGWVVGRSMGTNSPWNLQKEHSSDDSLFQPRKTHSRFWSPECWRINPCGLEPLCFQPFVRAAAGS